MTVDYHTCETFAKGFDAHFEAHPGDDLVVMESASYGGGDRLVDLVEERGGTLDVVENALFLCNRETWNSYADGREPPYRHEAFYRHVRRETGYLMADGEPVGVEWNFDDQNRETPPDDYDPPEPPRYEPDDLTRAVSEWVRDEFAGPYDEGGHDWADPEPFCWPVTREQALDALDRFLEDRLAAFGPYQDAMLADEWAMHHSLLSAAINVGLLHPAEVVERAIQSATERDDVPLNSLEGFVRQVIGWREFVRHVYRETMPDPRRRINWRRASPCPSSTGPGTPRWLASRMSSTAFGNGATATTSSG